MLSKLDMLAEKEPPVGTDDAEMPPTEKPGGASVLRALMCQCFVGDLVMGHLMSPGNFVPFAGDLSFSSITVCSTGKAKVSRMVKFLKRFVKPLMLARFWPSLMTLPPLKVPKLGKKRPKSMTQLLM